MKKRVSYIEISGVRTLHYICANAKWKGGEKMKTIKLLLSLLLVAGMLAYSTGAMSAEAPKPKGVKPGVTVVAVLNKAGTYCHLKFPPIEAGTLGSSKPRLATSGEIDFYGPCNYDPLGYEEVCKQRVQNAKQEFCD
jgi:hypothetical protein